MNFITALPLSNEVKIENRDKMRKCNGFEQNVTI